LLATVQQYSREQLQARGQEELEQVRHRHVEFFAEFAERAEAELVGPRQALWYACLEREHDNLRAALRWVIDCSELELGLRLGAALVRFWFIRGYFGEGSAWLNRLADLAHSGSSVSAAALAKILNGAGNFATLRGDFAGAKALLAESLRVRRELGDTAGVARTLLNLGNVAVSQRDFSAAEALFQESLALQRELGDDRGVARTLNNLSVVAREQEQTQRMLEYAEAAASLSRQVGDHEATALALVTLGIAARQRADLVASSALVKQSLRLFADLGHRRGIAECMELLAGLAYASGRPEQAARLFGAAETLAETVGLVPLAGDRFDYDQNVGAVRAELPEAVLALRWDEGRAMSLESALQAALNA
jgi:tetratricopeptide (TPR) repeat protein